LTEFVPTDQWSFLSYVEALPDEVSLQVFKSGKNKPRSSQSKEGIDREGLEDSLEQNEVTGQV